MHVLLAPIGTLGDVHPFVGLGSTLRKRGHRVTLVADGFFGPLADRAELGFVETASKQEYLDWLENPGRLTPSVASQLWWQRMLRLMPAVHSAISDHYVPGETVVIAPSWALGARIANDQFKVPLAIVHLQPFALQSICDRPQWPKWLPRGGLRLFNQYIRDVIAKQVGPQLNAFRAELGLPAVVYPDRSWSHSPQTVIGLFPDWFSAPQRDWPSEVRLVGFPGYDAAPTTDDTDEVDEFLSDGEPPIVFSQGSSIVHADSYFATSAEVARRLERRAILLTPFSRQIPQTLPPGVRHFKYMPFSRLLPRTAAHVHPGGIGTIAQTLAAGVPQMIVPTVNDQPDNSLRLQRLGVSVHVQPSAYRPGRAVRQLRRLIESNETARQCRTYAEICRNTNAFESACPVLEQLNEQDELAN